MSFGCDLDCATRNIPECGAGFGSSELAQRACRRGRRSNRASRFVKGARTLPAQSERRRDQESMLFRHGRNAPERFRRWEAGAPVLRCLRNLAGSFVPFRRVMAGSRFGTDRGFRHERRCAKNFSNAMDSKLTVGGVYVKAETKTSFKGYYPVSSNAHSILMRSFIQFDGEGDTADAPSLKTPMYGFVVGIALRQHVPLRTCVETAFVQHVRPECAQRRLQAPEVHCTDTYSEICPHRTREVTPVFLTLSRVFPWEIDRPCGHGTRNRRSL
jgi:hypothetical protein